MEHHLTGSFRVRAGRWAFQDARKWLPKIRDRAELRRHALKLRFWPENHPEDDTGKLLDLDWSWIQTSKKHIGELRIHDTIGGCDNLRVIFFVPSHGKESLELPTLWILAVLQKKRDNFTSTQIDNFEARQTIILRRFYGKTR